VGSDAGVISDSSPYTVASIFGFSGFSKRKKPDWLNKYFQFKKEIKMRTHNKNLKGALVIGLLLAYGLAYAEGGKVAGSASLSYNKQEASVPPSANGQMLVFGELSGTNKNTDGSGYMDNAVVDNREIGQLFQGNGPHTGYYTMTKGADSTTALWKGQVTTILAEDGSPRTSFKGTWEYVSGAGKYTGIKGTGNYSGHFTSKTTYNVDWNGEYSVK
jgi:hypothetical protein